LKKKKKAQNHTPYTRRSSLRRVDDATVSILLLHNNQTTRLIQMNTMEEYGGNSITNFAYGVC
jgi:hypothetical protein